MRVLLLLLGVMVVSGQNCARIKKLVNCNKTKGCVKKGNKCLKKAQPVPTPKPIEIAPAPSPSPTVSPTASPVPPTENPTSNPTDSPTQEPSSSPSSSPTPSPTTEPTKTPTWDVVNACGEFTSACECANKPGMKKFSKQGYVEGMCAWDSESEECRPSSEGGSTNCQECSEMKGCTEKTCSEMRCKYRAQNSCQCDEKCVGFDNCCEDYNDICVDMGCGDIQQRKGCNSSEFGCYWTTNQQGKGGSCIPRTEIACDDFASQKPCNESTGCIWIRKSVRSKRRKQDGSGICKQSGSCDVYERDNNCNKQEGCFWSDGGCVDTPNACAKKSRKECNGECWFDKKQTPRCQPKPSCEEVEGFKNCKKREDCVFNKDFKRCFTFDASKCSSADSKRACKNMGCTFNKEDESCSA